MILASLDEAQRAGARLAPACAEFGLDVRTVQRWRRQSVGDDGRHGPKSEPPNKLSEAERAEVLEVATSKRFRDKSPKQIVPLLADEERYIASESTFYRILREAELNAHRGRAKPPAAQPPREQCATGPNQVWSWDITYLRASVRGTFYYLFLYVDVWSRKIVGWRIEENENSELAADLLNSLCTAQDVDPKQLVVHMDNGAPMKGATFKATMDRLGVTPSFSRPRVSDDNPYSESLFRTLKYVPNYPKGPFESLEHARSWVAQFVDWYNHEHLHSGIGFVAPADRHTGRADAILKKRSHVYDTARRLHPERWSGATRAWSAPVEVFLNPGKETRIERRDHAMAA